MAAASPIRPPAFPAAVSAALALPSPLFQYPSIYHHPATAAAAAAAAAAASSSGSGGAGSSGSASGDALALKPLGLPAGLSHFQAMNHSQLASEMAKLKSPFINRNYLELAMLVCNTFRGKLFPCPHCRYVTDRRNNLKRHVSTMHQACDKVLECCGVQFNTKASLREHIMIFHHNGYSCPYCGRRFCRKALLKRHLSVHSGQKDYRCPHCDYATSHKSNLERHKRIHERLRMFDDDDDEAGKAEFLAEADHDDVDDEDEDDEIEVGSEGGEMMMGEFGFMDGRRHFREEDINGRGLLGSEDGRELFERERLARGSENRFGDKAVFGLNPDHVRAEAAAQGFNPERPSTETGLNLTRSSARNRKDSLGHIAHTHRGRNGLVGPNTDLDDDDDDDGDDDDDDIDLDDDDDMLDDDDELDGDVDERFKAKCLEHQQLLQQ
nr:hypothetical protein BaRGS_019147 [Batillaria attramentaria]